MAMNRFERRLRLERIPAAALGALAAVLALTTSATAAVLMVLAAAAAYWAMREARRFVIAPSRDDQTELVGLAELAPLLEAMPDPALLVDSEGRIVSSNAAARRQMHFEARGQFLTARSCSIAPTFYRRKIMPPTTLEALEAAALQLSTAERSQLAERLLVSLEEGNEIMLAWYAEAAGRGEAFARGEETASPASEVIERLQAMTADLAIPVPALPA